MNVVAVRPLDAFSTGFTCRANGNAVSIRNVLVIACDGYGGAATGTDGIRATQLAHEIEDGVVADLDRPVLQERRSGS